MSIKRKGKSAHNAVSQPLLEFYIQLFLCCLCINTKAPFKSFNRSNDELILTMLKLT